MKAFIVNAWLLLIGISAALAQQLDPEIARLKNYIDQKTVYDARKQQKIDELQVQLDKAAPLNLQLRFDIYSKLYDEYKSFNYGKAFNYAQKLQQMGTAINDPTKIAYAKVKMGFILLSSGMFKETFDTLRSVKLAGLPRSVKEEYYLLTARTYYDLADFDRDSFYTSIYNSNGNQYIDSATRLCDHTSFEYIYYNGLKYIKSGELKKAVQNLRLLIDHQHLSDHQYAVTTSTLSDIYIQHNKPDSAAALLIGAAIADIKSSTKEAAAMLNLAQLLDKRGNTDDAYLFIKQAMDDAVYYGARQRKVQVSAILPVIASARILSEQGQKRAFMFYSLLLTLFAVVVVVFIVIISKQLKRIKATDKLLVEANANLRHTIEKLNEAEKIKEEYIGYYLNIISDYMNKLERFKNSIEQRLTTRKFDDIKLLISNINLKKEREELFSNFDKAFLKLFPNFVTEFNNLFPTEHQTHLLPDQLLNSDLRIFALVRLGISDTDKIARILEYSLNTIYNYRTRIKNKSYDPDGFEAHIMGINAV
ncbi:DUF6377 domain-containing protein [Mucilaginibacter sp. 22184]|uniref:DUF6377 domain-containing protein n=1 Tax=Mucilaginibacter sp. 22184 TaxID=3453887 RepID=UPI003F87A0F8